jgi:hypothetical protein
MLEQVQRRGRMRKRLWLVLVALAVILTVIIVPPLLSIGRYKSQITHLVSASLGRPVRLSSVELRLFPRPGFVLTDLTVEEDPAYGAEPVLHANRVTAAIRLISLWRGKLEISRISVDEASLNLVRSGDGRWNLDPFFRTAAAPSNGAKDKAPPIPYLEATNSRVNIKNGLEKLPFSLVNADLSFWQENPGDWRLRLRGQPARTDVSLDLADTGIVRLEASLGHALELSKMPIHLVMEWREAQLGQLSRLIVGSDPGWRGDLRGQLQLDGTAETAQVKTRLSATGVHRVEFAPADPLDFDANCAFVYHYSGRAIEKLACDSPLGDGRIRVAGDLPGSAPAKLTVELQRIPLSAGLDLLRTLRSGIGEELQVKGTLSGQLNYSQDGVQTAADKPVGGRSHSVTKWQAVNKSPAASPLLGNLSVDGFALNGAGLSQPIQTAKVILQPDPSVAGQSQALTGTFAFPAGGVTPLTIAAHFSLNGYELAVRGPASLARIRDLAHIAGIASTPPIDGLAGDPPSMDLDVSGPWMAPQTTSMDTDASSGSPRGLEDAPVLKGVADSDQIRGTMTLHNANWKPDALANHVEITQATLHLDRGSSVWDPVAFSYGPVKGTASLKVARECEAGEQCRPQLNLHFAELETAALQGALLGAHQQSTVLSSLIERFTRSSPPVWPTLEGTVKADALILGPIKLQNASIAFRVLPTGAEFTGIDAALLGGQIHATGKLANGNKPSYLLEGGFKDVTGAALCQLLAVHCTGGPIEGTGKVELSGFSETDLAASAKGALHFDWKHGGAEGTSSAELPRALKRFDHWTADAVIADGAVTMKQNQVQQGARKAEFEAKIFFGDPPRVTFAAPKSTDAAKR